MVKPRSNSIQRIAAAVSDLPVDYQQHDNIVTAQKTGSEVRRRKRADKRHRNDKLSEDSTEIESSPGLLLDLRSGQWIRHPESSFKIIVLILLAYYSISYTFPNHRNPLQPFITLSYPLHSGSDWYNNKYGRGLRDIPFMSFYIIVFSFARQSLIKYFLRPLALRLGISKESKTTRFTEQGYAALYFSVFGVLGLIVMSESTTGWYKTEDYFVSWPMSQMPASMKLYYLLEAANWLQQALVMLLRLEKPRKDFVELAFHHVVTLWLILWSYKIGALKIGIAIFVSMNIPDVFLAISKCINYVDGTETASAISFAIFVPIWTYFRHYLNIVILLALVTQWHLIDPSNYDDSFNIFRLQVMTPELQWITFASIAALQAVNLFWYWAIWRILIKSLRGQELADDRSDDEDDEAEPSSNFKKE